MTATSTDPRQRVPRVITPADVRSVAEDFGKDPRLTEVFRHLARLYSYEIDGTLGSYDARQLANYRNALRGFEEQLALLVRDDPTREDYRRILQRRVSLLVAPAPTPLPDTRPTGLPTTPPPAPVLTAPAPTPVPAPGQGDLEVPEYAYLGRPRDIDSRQIEWTGAIPVTPAAAAVAQDERDGTVTRDQVRRRNTVTTPARKSSTLVLSPGLADMLVWIGRARLVTTAIIARRFYPQRPGRRSVSEQAVYNQLSKLRELGLIEREGVAGRKTDAYLLWLSRTGVRHLDLEYELHFNYTPGVLRVGRRDQRHAKVVHHLACAQLLAEYESGSRPVPGELQGVLSAAELEQWAAASKDPDTSEVRDWLAEIGLVDTRSEFGAYAVQYVDATNGTLGRFKIADLWIHTSDPDGTLNNIAVEIELSEKPKAEYAHIARAYLNAAIDGTVTEVLYALPTNRAHTGRMIKAAFAEHAPGLKMQCTTFDPDPNQWPEHIRRATNRLS